MYAIIYNNICNIPYFSKMVNNSSDGSKGGLLRWNIQLLIQKTQLTINKLTENFLGHPGGSVKLTDNFYILKNWTKVINKIWKLFWY